MHKKEDLK